MGNYPARELIEDELDLKHLNLSKILVPEDYVKHTQGENLDGCLKAIPLEIIYYDTISLYEKVDLSFNYISFVPEEFSLRVPHLSLLNISHNQLTGLPNSFHLLLHLEILDLSYNKLEVFPDTLVKLPKLCSLNLSHNALKDIPSSVSNLQQLLKLNVSHNGLRALPETLLDCTNLKVIVTLGNSMIHPPQAVCDQGTFFTLEHLMKTRMNICNPSVSSKASGSLLPNIFLRVRGQQAMASVVNPESASMEYKQAQGRSRTNKKKCPLMLPDSATSLAPDQLQNAILGLVYGACIGDAFCLNTEDLTHDECLFYYSSDNLTLLDRIRDFLRSCFPPNDWSSNIDIMLLTLESLMRWGGVVDELELVSQIMQWKVHGIIDIDPFPGYPLSTLVQQVTSCDGYSGHPHSVAESYHKKVLSDQSKGLNLVVNPNDNSCLPAAVILGIPNFYKDNEVAMNAERICKASHSSPLARASCIFVSLLVAALLQGKLHGKNCDMESILLELRNKVLEYFPDEALQFEFQRIFQMDKALKCASNDVTLTIRYAVSGLLDVDDGFEKILSRLVMLGGTGIAAHGCVVGGILGAYYGFSDLPQKWLLELPKENVKWLNSKINQLLDLFGLP